MPPVTCPTCGKPLPLDAPHGLCPACLVRAGFDSDPNRASGPASGPPQVAGSSVVQALRANLPDLPPVLLRDPHEEGDSSVLTVPSAEGPPVPGDTRRYQIFGEIARGGIGAILRGRDVDLGRNLAIKVLLEGHADNSVMLRRFIEEAQIGGQLQHPGIVPVYELGRFTDGRPFFTMKLVKGQTLAKLLEERKDVGRAGSSRPTGTVVGLEDSAQPTSSDLPRFLAIFEQVCQTLAYAHARGVIHRDLKPSNVMVGSFGEVQVMDWGLAKVLHEGGVADEQRSRERPRGDDALSLVETVRTATPGAESRAGSVLGTPAYMAPEQARGEVEHLDQRCDVFGLGAILCKILTGEPPFVGRSSEDIRRKAASADLAAAWGRLDGCGADRELIVLAKRCLAAQPGDRPRDASAVAREMTAYLAGVQERLRHAELERAAAQVKVREERKRRQLALALATAVLALVMLGVGGGLWLERQQAERQGETVRREARVRAAVDGALDQAAALRRQGRWPEAEAVIVQAESRLDESGLDDLWPRLKQARVELALVARLENIRLKRLPRWEGESDDRSASGQYAKEFSEAGLTVEGDEAAVAMRIQESAIRMELVAALDDWAMVARDSTLALRLLRVARLANPSSDWNDRLHDPAVWRDRKALESLAEKAATTEVPAPLFTLLAVLLHQVGADPEPVLRAGQRRHPGDFSVNFDLARALHEVKPAEAVGFYRAALVRRPGSSGVYSNLGAALFKKGDVEEAIAAFRCALEIDPNNAKVHDNLGSALCQKGAVEEGIAAYRRALEINPNYANVYSNLGFALEREGQLDEAIAACRRALEIDPKHVKALTNLGIALREKGRFEEAITNHRRAIEIDSKNASAYNALGATLYKKGAMEEAIAAFRKAIEIDPKHAHAHDNIGAILAEKGQVEEAIAAYRRATEANPRYARARGGLGYNLLRLGRFAEARTETQRALDLFPASDPQRKVAQQQLHECQRLLALEVRLAAILQRIQQPDGASGQRELAEFCLAYKQRYAAAARFFAAAFATDPRLADNLLTGDRYNAACAAALAATGRGADAVPLDDQEGSRLRQQSLAWLRADLAAWTKLAGNPKEHARIRQTLQHWREDADLARIRDLKELAKLPADEQDACKNLWAETAALLKKVEK
jgi:eukaryotic-like serine/threonine-protein kinase